MKNRKQYLKVVIIGLSLVMVIFILRNLFIGRNSTEGLIPNYYSGEEIQEFIDTSDTDYFSCNRMVLYKSCNEMSCGIIEVDSILIIKRKEKKRKAIRHIYDDRN